MNMDKVSLVKKKICLLGAFAVGKTSTVERFVHSRFSEKYMTTLGVKVSQKTMPPMEIPGSAAVKQYRFLIWDIAGMEKFDKTVRNYYRGASGALAVADLTRPETIPELLRIVTSFRAVNPDADLVILGNKSDIFQGDEATLELMEKASETFGGEHLFVSAKTGDNVEAAFLMLAGKMGAK